ncbi:hypothetical protein B484DRAFT_399226 [Ochromonadaceae sp. CCMP2298]|nr:hypothetical protein B484DRAFT_399226 [Ochromonadaceae sp. CCMP2298]
MSMGDEGRKDRDSGEPKWMRGTMIGFLLGDVSYDMFIRKFKNVLIGFGHWLFKEIDEGIAIDWKSREPLKKNRIRGETRRADGTVKKQWRDWDDALDLLRLTEDWAEWKRDKDYYFKKRPHLWVFMMQSVNEAVDTELCTHSTFEDLRRQENTLGLWVLFQEITKGVATNNASLLKQHWEGLRYVVGNSITGFWLAYDSGWEQCDHAAPNAEAKIPDSTKAW